MDWNARYVDADTPWDKGVPAPMLPWVLAEHRHRFPEKARSLVPGCGRGHDALCLAEHGFETLGFDVSPQAIEEAQALHTHPCLRWQVGDLFTELSPASTDLIWEHTCFCAILPEQREAYIRAMAEALTSGGQLLASFFWIPVLHRMKDPHSRVRLRS